METLKQIQNERFLLNKLRSESQEFLESVEEIDFKFSGQSSTNGRSVYYKAYKKGEKFDDLDSLIWDKGVKLRFSDHGISNLHRMQTEICLGIKNFESKIPEILYKLGIEGYEFGPTKKEVKIVEMPKMHVCENCKIISERVTKKGTIMVTVEKSYDDHFAYYKK